jgi:allantoicase
MTHSFLELVDLASEHLGASVIEANDEFFAPKERLIRARAPMWLERRYTDRGKWMDGWETRRRREPGHDWCVVRLGVPGMVRGVDVETTHFKGNFPEGCAIDVSEGPSSWCEVLPNSPLAGDTHNLFAIEGAPRAAFLRLRIFPDGGVARLRVYGEVVPDWDRLRGRGQVDLAAVENGGTVVACSDMFFGSRHNLIMPGDARSMADGWETKRRRGPGHDWTVVRLGAPGIIRRIEIDTRRFKGNAPGACSLEGVSAPGIAFPGDDQPWHDLLRRTPLEADARQTFEDGIVQLAAVTHVRFNIFPDGGVGRLRLFGDPA